MRPMRFTVLDPATGKTTSAKGPDWGTPESVPFWRPVFARMREILAARGLEPSMALGLGTDRVPSKQAIADLAAAAPGVRWVIHSHGRYDSFPKGKPLALNASVWGVKGPFVSTDRRYTPGWANRVLQTVFPRAGAGSIGQIHAGSPIGVFHACTESYLASGYNGVDRMGADFWAVIPGRRRGRVQTRATILSRFPTWQRPGAPTLTHGSLLFPGARGALATVRFEALRMGVQEAEARVAVEKAIRDTTTRAAIGDELAARARALLDERVRAIVHAKRDWHSRYSNATEASWLQYAHDSQERARRLYRAAAEISGRCSE
jgi:hypothetical protein